MVTLREELRKMDYEDIKFEILCIKEFREIENRHYYQCDFPTMLPLIGACDLRLRKLIKDYEKNWGVRLRKRDI